MPDAPHIPRIITTIDPKQFKDLMWTLAAVPDGARIAAMTSINKTAAHGRTLIAKAVSEQMTARISSINARITIRKASRDRLFASIDLHGDHGVSLIGFGAKQTSTGVVAKIMGQSKEFPHDFIREGLNHNKLVFEAEGEKRAMTRGRYAGAVFKRGPKKGQPILRTPIHAVTGPPVTDVFEETPGLADKALADIGDYFNKTLDSQVTWLLKKEHLREIAEAA